jgi:hypothetical protein
MLRRYRVRAAGFAPLGDTVGNYISYSFNGTISLNGFGGCTGSPVATLVAGQTADISIDFAAKLLGVRPAGGNWNNSPTASPATGTGMFDLTCGNTTSPPTPPLFIGAQTGFATDAYTLGPVPDAGSGTLAGFSNF